MIERFEQAVDELEQPAADTTVGQLIGWCRYQRLQMTARVADD